MMHRPSANYLLQRAIHCGFALIVLLCSANGLAQSDQQGEQQLSPQAPQESQADSQQTPQQSPQPEPQKSPQALPQQAQPQQQASQARQEDRDNVETQKRQSQTGKTIWLEEKLNPSTQWLEKTVKPLTRWIEKQVQLRPKEESHAQGKNEAQARTAVAPNNSGDNSSEPLSKAQIRSLVKQRYAGEVLHIKAQGAGQYRVKLISQQGVIQILYLNAQDGTEVTP